MKTTGTPKRITFELIFVLTALAAIGLISLFIPQKIAFINFYFLPVIAAGYFMGIRRSVLGAVLCILLVIIYAILYPKMFTLPSTTMDLYLYILAWGCFLVLAGAVVGLQHEKLKAEIRQTKELNRELVASYKKVEDARASTILGLAKLSEYRDEDTGKHLERIREYARKMAMELSKKSKYHDHITEKYIEDLYHSSILHDIGKVGIPDAILLKPGKLTSEEFEVIKKHASLGGDVIKAIESRIEGQSFLTLAREIAYSHHEKWNGNGYPRGLKGEEIPLSARIVALADVYDALTSKRIYKDAFPHEKAAEIIISEKGEHFDPDVVDAFIALQTEFNRIRREFVNSDEDMIIFQDQIAHRQVKAL